MKILIIGLGSIAKKHIKAIRKIDPHANIYALRSSKNSGAYANVQNIYQYCDIQKIAPDFAMICTPTAKHFKAIQKLYSYNIPLFIEKPVVSDLSSAKDLINLFGATKYLTYVACNLRFLEAIAYIKNYLDEKKSPLNEVNIYAGSYLPNWRPNRDFKQSYSAIPELGGGVHLDLIHELDYAYWLFGQPKKVTSVKRSSSSLKIKAIDFAFYLLEYQSFSAIITLNYYRRDYKRTMELIFEDDTITIDLANNTVHSFNDGLLYKSPKNIGDTYISQLRYFSELVKMNKKESFNSIIDGINVLKICINE